jgi:transposase
VWIPDEAQEALRDLTRAREDMKHLQRQAKQRLLSFLSRHGHRYNGRSRWTQAHWRWLEGIKFARPEQQIVLQEYIDTVQACSRRVASLDREVETAAHASPVWPVIEALMALRGISLLAAVTVVAELGDLARFANAPQLMAYLGLVPSEHSSGKRERRGGITKTGNGHVRRVLIEAAWTYRHAARKTAILQRRAERTPPEVQEIAWSAQKRLCQRFRNLMARGKLKNQVCTAIARELVGFIWAIGQYVIPLSRA